MTHLPKRSKPILWTVVCRRGGTLSGCSLVSMISQTATEPDEEEPAHMTTATDVSHPLAALLDSQRERENKIFSELNKGWGWGEESRHLLNNNEENQ